MPKFICLIVLTVMLIVAATVVISQKPGERPEVTLLSPEEDFLACKYLGRHMTCNIFIDLLYRVQFVSNRATIVAKL